MVYIIAEAASAHDGDFGKAERLVEMAIGAGCSAAKFQYWSDADALADRRHVGLDYRAVYRRYAIPLEWIAALSGLAHQAGCEFVCSAFLPADFALIAPYCDRIKVASFECEALDILQAAKASGKEWIVSTGMTDLDAVYRLVNRLREWWGPGHASILHCVSAYPAPMDSLNLSLLTDTEDRESPFGGFSDHSANVLTGAIAVAAGARVIEAHVRLADTSVDNPDFACALDPEQFREYVVNIRLAEAAMGDGVKRMMPAEEVMSRYRVRS